MKDKGTYVYCLVAAQQPPAVPRRGGLPGAGRPRVIAFEANGRLGRWLVVADVPLNLYGEAAINARLNDLDWVSRAAVAHEAVVESFIDARALLPMKLFTIFTSDERAIEHLQRQRARIAATLRRVADRREWGVRVMLDRPAASVPPRAARTGAGYLAAKRAQRAAVAELASRAQDVVARLFDDLSGIAADAVRRAPGELPVKGGPLLLDAAFLVPRTRQARFAAAVKRRGDELGRQGYRVSLTGPWPAYSFMRE